MSKKWIIDFGKKAIPPHIWENEDFEAQRRGISEGHFCGGLINFQVAGNYFIGLYFYKNKPQMVLYDCNNSRVINIAPTLINYGGTIPLFLNPPFHMDGENFIAVLEPFLVINYFEALGLDIAAPFDTEDITLTSNPVLQIIKLKR